MVSAMVRPVVLERVVDFGAAAEEGLGHLVAGLGEGDGDVADGLAEAADKVLAAGRHLADHGLAGVGEGDGDLLAAVGERHGDAIAGVGNVLGNRFGGDAEILGEGFLRRDDRGANALGIDDDRLALAGKVVDQRTHARFVVGIGAFEGGNLVVDEEFEFARRGQGRARFRRRRRRPRGEWPG